MSFEDLEVWKRSSRICVDLYKHVSNLNDFGFKDQITRSAMSIPSNIAEGSERDSQKDFNRFLHYAKGSCAELRTQLYIGIEIGYINKSMGMEWIKETRELSAMLVGLINPVKKSINN